MNLKQFQEMYWKGTIWPNTPKYTKKGSRFIINDYFIYIQIPKSGSTALSKTCFDNNLTLIKKGYKHEGYHFLKKFSPNKKIEYITTIRNPFTQILSYFFYSLRKNEKYQTKISKKKLIKYFVKWLKKNINNTHINQLEYLKINGKISKNITILKYEDHNTFKYINQKYGLNLINKRVNITKHRYYKDIKDFYQDPELLLLIKKKFGHMFKVLGYSLDINKINLKRSH